MGQPDLERERRGVQVKVLHKQTDDGDHRKAAIFLKTK